jgi:hypothetical protein
MRRTLSALAGLTTGVLAAAAALIPALPASAAPPFTRVHLVVDFTRPVDICAFPVIAHSGGTLTGKEYRDSNGVLVHEVDNVQRNYTIAYSNPANGRSISTSLGGTVTYDFRPDGSYAYVIAGLERMFIAHGQGPIAKQVGRIVVDVAPDGTQTTLFQAGRWDGDLNGPICAYLA